MSGWSSITFAWPWLLLLLPLPWILRELLPARPDRRADALRLPSSSGFRDLAVGTLTTATVARVRAAAMALAWLLLVVAAARPQQPAGEQSAPVTGRNLMLAVDLSGSMGDKDFVLGDRRVERLTATKAVGGDFIERRVGDRVGLILFGERAYLQAPLTFDRETVKTLLYESAIGLAGQKTAIGDAIALAIKRVRETEADARNQVLVLLTDGANTAGNIEPAKAAELAAAIGLKIYTIGIGADAASRTGGLLRPLPMGTSDLDEPNLQRIAALTGGRYFRARDTASLTRIYEELDELEPAADEQSGFRPREELYHWPAAAALLLVLVMGTDVRRSARDE